MRTLLTALIMLLPIQDAAVDRRVAGLVRDLKEDGLEARDQAANGLLALGPKALPALKVLIATEAEGDVKARMLTVLKALEQRARREELAGAPTLVTLQAERLTLKEAAAALNRQAKTQILVPKDLQDVRVSVAFADVPMLEGVDRLCKALPGVTFRLPGAVWSPANPCTTIALMRGEHSRIPRLVKDQFVLELAAVSTVQEFDFTEITHQEMVVEFRSLWEQGTRPLGAALRLTAIEDDQGKSYLDAMQQPPISGDSEKFVAQFHTVRFGTTLPPGVKAFKRISGEIEFRFPIDIEILKVAAPIGRSDVEVKGELFACTLSSMVRDGRAIKVTLKAAMASNPLNRSIVLVDGGGKTYASINGSLHFGTDQLTAYLDYDVPSEAEIAELRVTLPKPGASQRLPFSFENVKIR